jgi:hypothetical protein
LAGEADDDTAIVLAGHVQGFTFSLVVGAPGPADDVIAVSEE